MTVIAARLGRSTAGRSALLGVAGAALFLLGVVIAVAVNGLSVSITLALLGGLCLCGFTLLAIRNYDMAVLVALLLMGFVRFQPAPTDAAFAVIMLVAAVTGRFRVARVPLLARWLVALLLILNLLSFVDAVELKEAVQFVFITAYLLIFAIWIAGYIDSTEKTRTVLITWLIVGVASAVLAVAALYLPIPGRALILSNVDGGERAAGFFKDPNVFGPFLVPPAVILLEQRIAVHGRSLTRMRPLVSSLVIAILTIGVLFSFSRAAWGNYALAVGVMLLASAIRRRGARRAMRALVTLLATAGVTFVVLSATGSIGFLQHRAQLQNYDTKRFAAQSFGWELGWTHPLGVGPGQFRFHYPVESHSTFVRTVSEQGPLGLALWVAILLFTLVLALRNVAIGRDTYGIGSAALLGCWCGLIFNSAVVDTLHWRHLWLVAALIWASTTIRPRSRRVRLDTITDPVPPPTLSPV